MCEDYLKKIIKRLQAYALLMRLHKPIGILLLLWPTLWALWIAGDGKPTVKNVIIFVLGVIVMRSAGCVINDFADRNIDGRVARTRERPLVTSLVSPKAAIVLFIILSAIALVLVSLLNPLTISLAVIGIIVTIIYPFLKRVTHLPQLGLSIAFAWGVPMAFAAQINTVPLVAWFLFLITASWIIAYDTLYAMADRDDDLRIGVKSTAILFAKQDRLIIGILQSTTVIMLVLLGVWLTLHGVYYFCLLVTAGFFIYQQYLIKDRNPQKSMQAFLNNNWVGLLIFLGIILR